MALFSLIHKGSRKKTFFSGLITKKIFFLQRPYCTFFWVLTIHCMYNILVTNNAKICGESVLQFLVKGYLFMKIICRAITQVTVWPLSSFLGGSKVAAAR